MAKNHEISHSNLKEWSEEQLEEMLGEDNRRFFRNAHGREPENDDELVMHYIENGGAEDFNKRHGEE